MWVYTLSGAWAQDNQDNSVPADTFSSQRQPVPAYAQEGAPALASENPPLAGLDLPSREVTANTYSYGFAGLGGGTHSDAT